MLAYKLAGAVLILSVGVFAAYSAVRYEKRRLSVLDGWIDLILYIRMQIDCFLMPLGEILERGESALLQASPTPVGERDLQAICNASALYTDGEVKRLLDGFVREIGSGNREEQLRRCDYYASALRVQRERLAQALPARIRLCASLSVCIALGIALLLW